MTVEKKIDCAEEAGCGSRIIDDPHRHSLSTCDVTYHHGDTVNSTHYWRLLITHILWSPCIGSNPSLSQILEFTEVSPSVVYFSLTSSVLSVFVAKFLSSPTLLSKFLCKICKKKSYIYFILFADYIYPCMFLWYFLNFFLFLVRSVKADWLLSFC